MRGLPPYLSRWIAGQFNKDCSVIKANEFFTTEAFNSMAHEIYNKMMGLEAYRENYSPVHPGPFVRIYTENNNDDSLEPNSPGNRHAVGDTFIKLENITTEDNAHYSVEHIYRPGYKHGETCDNPIRVSVGPGDPSFLNPFAFFAVSFAEGEEEYVVIELIAEEYVRRYQKSVQIVLRYEPDSAYDDKHQLFRGNEFHEVVENEERHRSTFYIYKFGKDITIGNFINALNDYEEEGEHIFSAGGRGNGDYTTLSGKALVEQFNFYNTDDPSTLETTTKILRFIPPKPSIKILSPESFFDSYFNQTSDPENDNFSILSYIENDILPKTFLNTGVYGFLLRAEYDCAGYQTFYSTVKKDNNPILAYIPNKKKADHYLVDETSTEDPMGNPPSWFIHSNKVIVDNYASSIDMDLNYLFVPFIEVTDHSASFFGGKSLSLDRLLDVDYVNISSPGEHIPELLASIVRYDCAEDVEQHYSKLNNIFNVIKGFLDYNPTDSLTDQESTLLRTTEFTSGLMWYLNTVVIIDRSLAGDTVNEEDSIEVLNMYPTIEAAHENGALTSNKLIIILSGDPTRASEESSVDIYRLQPQVLPKLNVGLKFMVLTPKPVEGTVYPANHSLFTLQGASPGSVTFWVKKPEALTTMGPHPIACGHEFVLSDTVEYAIEDMETWDEGVIYEPALFGVKASSVSVYAISNYLSTHRHTYMSLLIDNTNTLGNLQISNDSKVIPEDPFTLIDIDFIRSSNSSFLSAEIGTGKSGNLIQYLGKDYRFHKGSGIDNFSNDFLIVPITFIHTRLRTSCCVLTLDPSYVVSGETNSGTLFLYGSKINSGPVGKLSHTIASVTLSNLGSNQTVFENALESKGGKDTLIGFIGENGYLEGDPDSIIPFSDGYFNTTLRLNFYDPRGVTIAEGRDKSRFGALIQVRGLVKDSNIAVEIYDAENSSSITILDRFPGDSEDTEYEFGEGAWHSFDPDIFLYSTEAENRFPYRFLFLDCGVDKIPVMGSGIHVLEDHRGGLLRSTNLTVSLHKDCALEELKAVTIEGVSVFAQEYAPRFFQSRMFQRSPYIFYFGDQHPLFATWGMECSDHVTLNLKSLPLPEELSFIDYPDMPIKFKHDIHMGGDTTIEYPRVKEVQTGPLAGLIPLNGRGNFTIISGLKFSSITNDNMRIETKRTVRRIVPAWPIHNHHKVTGVNLLENTRNTTVNIRKLNTESPNHLGMHAYKELTTALYWNQDTFRGFSLITASLPFSDNLNVGTELNIALWATQDRCSRITGLHNGKVNITYSCRSYSLPAELRISSYYTDFGYAEICTNTDETEKDTFYIYNKEVESEGQIVVSSHAFDFPETPVLFMSNVQSSDIKIYPVIPTTGHPSVPHGLAKGFGLLFMDPSLRNLHNTISQSYNFAEGSFRIESDNYVTTGLPTVQQLDYDSPLLEFANRPIRIALGGNFWTHFTWGSEETESIQVITMPASGNKLNCMASRVNLVQGAYNHIRGFVYDFFTKKDLAVLPHRLRVPDFAFRPYSPHIGNKWYPELNNLILGGYNTDACVVRMYLSKLYRYIAFILEEDRTTTHTFTNSYWDQLIPQDFLSDSNDCDLKVIPLAQHLNNDVPHNHTPGGFIYLPIDFMDSVFSSLVPFEGFEMPPIVPPVWGDPTDP